jgi:hypothetical protein
MHVEQRAVGVEDKGVGAADETGIEGHGELCGFLMSLPAPLDVPSGLLKIILDGGGKVCLESRIPSARGTLSRGVVRVGRERRLRPGSREPRAREAKANSGGLAYLRTTPV